MRSGCGVLLYRIELLAASNGKFIPAPETGTILDRMEKANRNGECDEIERFATTLGRNPHCTYNPETQSHILEVGGESVTITREDFDGRKWQKKIRKATKSRRSLYN
jgi:hypothetical protein